MRPKDVNEPAVRMFGRTVGATFRAVAGGWNGLLEPV
jgi:hypothetical protein